MEINFFFQVFVLPLNRGPRLRGRFSEAVSAEPKLHGPGKKRKIPDRQFRRNCSHSLHGHGLDLRSAPVVEPRHRRVPPDQQREPHEHLQTGKQVFHSLPEVP